VRAEPLKAEAVRVAAFPIVTFGDAVRVTAEQFGAATTLTLVFAVTESPAALLTVNMNVVVALRTPVESGTVEVTLPREGATTPSPLPNTAVSVVELLAVTVDAAGTKEVINGRR